MAKIGLIDYGMGNIHSVTKALESLEEEIILIKNNHQIKDCKALILPGVGSFDPAINNLSKTCLLYTSPSPRDRTRSRMPSSA